MNSSEPVKGDVVRGILGAVSTTIVLALLSERSVSLLVFKLLFFSGLAATCVLTAKSKAVCGLHSIEKNRHTYPFSLQRLCGHPMGAQTAPVTIGPAVP